MSNNEIDLFDLFREEFAAPAKEEVVNVPDNSEDLSTRVDTTFIPQANALVGNELDSDFISDDLRSLFESMSEEDHQLIDSAAEMDSSVGYQDLDFANGYNGEEDDEEDWDDAPDTEELVDLVMLEGEEVLTGTIVAIPEPILEGEVIRTTKDTLSEFQKAVDKLADLENVDRELDEETTSMRLQINEAQKLLDKLKSEYARKMEKRGEHKKTVSQARTIVSEEAHKEAERIKADEINKQRKSSMLQFHRDIEELNPEWFRYAYDHQWEGASTLALHGSGLLADDMGLGKTLSAIMWLDMVKGKKNLIITPADTNSNFTMEVSMWAGHRFVVPLAGADKAGRNVMWDMVIRPRIDAGQDVTISLNFEQLYSDKEYFDKLMAVEWDTVIIDEFHNAKNVKSVLFDRLVQLQGSNIDKDPESETYGQSLVKFLPMTGTFILNKPEDIWPALHLVDPKAFPNMYQFRDFYCDYDYSIGAWGFRPGGERSMLIALGGRIVKRTMKEAGIILPKQTIHNVSISFDDNYHDQRRIMRQLAEHSQLILDSERKVSIIEQIALITRQRQAAVFPAGIVIKDPETGEIAFSVGEEVQESIKMDWVVNKIMEKRASTELFPQGERIAVFSQFKGALAELETRLIALGIKVARYDGDSTRELKMKVKRDFDRKHVEIAGSYEFEVVLCNYKTGGVGLNFTHATQLIILDKEWNPGKENQALARTNRIGQTQENEVWIPILEGSIDEWMESLNERKEALIAGFDTEVDMQKEFSDFLSTVKDI